MVGRVLIALALVAGGVVGPAQPAAAEQTVNFTLGYFALRGEDARMGGDVLAANRNFLTFDPKDFNGVTLGGEWLVPFGRYVEGGVGAGYYRRTVPSLYTRFVNANGSEITQDLRLRIVPITVTVRAVAFGHDSPVQPYVGVGLAVYSWRYSETGQFVDFGDRNAIFRDRYVASGTSTGPVVMGGVRFGAGTPTTGFEIRYQKGEGTLDRRFAGDTIDLGGYAFTWTIGLRF